MLTRLRLKNWRSIKEETIDFTTPITVFIGANSAGKTNVIDALSFYRDQLQKGIVQTVSDIGGYKKVQRDTIRNKGSVELEVVFDSNFISEKSIREHLVLQFDKRDAPFKFGRQLFEDDILLLDQGLRELPIRDALETSSFRLNEEEAERQERGRKILTQLYALVQRRWQILGDSFAPRLKLTGREGGDLYIIEPDARNVLLILDFMRRVEKSLFDDLESDLLWLLYHVTGLEVLQNRPNRELELLLRENDGKVAQTVSLGTMRLIAILTANYALNMPQENIYSTDPQILSPYMPGLIIVEEPDMALNPGLLQKFVGQLRNYTTPDGYPRQFILTTHNPAFLDFFEPEEVRVVERDEHGYTHVRHIPDYIKDIWLDKYALGEVWTTNSFGGLPE